MSRFPIGIQDFGDSFIYMQDQRQQADYSPSAAFSRERVILMIDQADDAIDSLEKVPGADRRAFALHVLLRRQRQ